MKKFVLVIIILSSCCFSCNKENIKEEYYPNGKLKLRIQVNNTIANGLYEEYYETGELKAKSTYKNGLLIDTVFTYHKNGKLESKGIQKNNLPIGWWTYYNSQGRLNEKREILIINGKSFLNQLIKYDPKGKIDLKNSSFFELAIQDSLILGRNVGEIFYHHDTLGYQKRYITIVVDNQYSENLIKKDTFVGEENKNWFGIYNYKIGKQKISGSIEEQLVFPTLDKNGAPNYTIRTFTKYFKKEVYVIKE